MLSIKYWVSVLEIYYNKALLMVGIVGLGIKVELGVVGLED